MIWEWLIQSGEIEKFLLLNPIALNLFPLVKASKRFFPYTCKIYSWTRIGWPMGIWLLVVSYWKTNQKPFLLSILISKKWDRETNPQRGWEKGPRRNSRLPKKHLFHSRPEELPTTFRHYKNSKSQNFRDVSVTLTARHRHSSSLDILSFSVCQEKQTSFVCYLLPHKRVSIKKKFFSILWVARQSSLSYYLTFRGRSGWIMSTPLHGSFKHSVGTEEFDDAKQSESNVVVTNKIATTVLWLVPTPHWAPWLA